MTRLNENYAKNISYAIQVELGLKPIMNALPEISFKEVNNQSFRNAYDLLSEVPPAKNSEEEISRLQFIADHQQTIIENYFKYHEDKRAKSLALIKKTALELREVIKPLLEDKLEE